MQFILLFRYWMKAIDLQTYQTLNKTLIIEQEHPYQPYHSQHHQQYQSNSHTYHSIKKALKQMSIQQHNPNIKEQICPKETITEVFQLTHSDDSDIMQRFNTDDLLKMHQHFIIHPQTKKQLSQNSTFTHHHRPQHHRQPQEASQPAQKMPFQMKEVIQSSSNVPIKQENYYENIKKRTDHPQKDGEKIKQITPQRYPFLFLANLLLIASLLLSLLINDEYVWFMQAGIILIYILITYFHQIRKKAFAIKKFELLQAVLQNVTANKGYFIFNIECFHYIHTQNGDQKVVTYKKSERFIPHSIIDESICMQDLKNPNKFTDISPKSSFYFEDKQSEQKFSASFNQFVVSNIKDLHQSYSFNWQVQQINDLSGTYSENGSHCCICYIILCLLGLSFTFAMWFECCTCRYEARIIKRVTIQ